MGDKDGNVVAYHGGLLRTLSNNVRGDIDDDAMDLDVNLTWTAQDQIAVFPSQKLGSMIERGGRHAVETKQPGEMMWQWLQELKEWIWSSSVSGEDNNPYLVYLHQVR